MVKDHPSSNIINGTCGCKNSYTYIIIQDKVVTFVSACVMLSECHAMTKFGHTLGVIVVLFLSTLYKLLGL